MYTKKTIIGINGSASQNSSNLALLKKIAEYGKADFELIIIDDLADYPLFRTELTDENVPEKIITFRQLIEKADGVIVCTPEYVFSIPAGLKNILEWCVSTTVFSDKPAGLITASASGEKGHEELQLILKTIMAKFTPETTLLIQGIKGKMNRNGEITNSGTEKDVRQFVKAFTAIK
tara:strand:+ start:4119 stop:4649 length:531 start_codon:yes stop_codon:yes gene_type:complete